MSKLLIASIFSVIAAAVVGGILWFKNSAKPPAPSAQNTVQAQLPQNAWLEVVKPKVFSASPDGKTKKELKTGDEVLAGATLETDKQGLATIHFPDGSVARLEGETKLTLSESQFNPQTEKLTVKMSLSVGRVWSKIIELVTPDSLWEVKTANAVATVRGTAFGVGFLKGQSRVVVSENKVKTGVLDPKTGAEIKGAEVVISENQFAAIKTEDIPKIKETLQITAAEIKAAPADVQEWVDRNEKEDIELEQKIEELEAKALEGRDLREELREEIFKEFEEEIKAREEEQKEAEQVERRGKKAESDKIEGDIKNVEAEKNKVAVQSLLVSTRRDLSGVSEGDQITFSAIAVMSDGAKVNVTATAKWHVIGPIGKIISPGVFSAGLIGADIQEMGSAPGQIAATYKDPASGKELTGATQIFNVEARVSEVLERDG